jgi:GNAT superfamily N-acetyltransferase
VLDVRRAETPADLDEARRLFRAFVTWQRARPDQDVALVEAYFDEAAWEREVAGLPGAYAAPDGALLLAWDEPGVAVGCVALRRRDERGCEMKRMYVDGPGRGRGVGRALGEAIVAAARDAGYEEMLLDTSIGQREALGLYRSLGFVDVEPYYDVAPVLRDWLVFLRLEL